MNRRLRNLVHSVSFLAMLLGLIVGASAQGGGSCQCSSVNCEASQSCPTGYSPHCNCTDNGCASTCIKNTPPVTPPQTVVDFTNLIGDWDETVVSSKLSEGIGRSVEFVKTNTEKVIKTDGPSTHRTYWKAFEYFSTIGGVSIDGLSFEVWENRREVLLRGGEYTICADNVPVQTILNELNFLTERNFTIAAGDRLATGKGRIVGKNLDDVLSSLAKMRGVLIVESGK
jgi:hypothetical protein